MSASNAASDGNQTPSQSQETRNRNSINNPKVVLLNAKGNHKYRIQEERNKKRKKKSNRRPRLNQDDINFYNHFIQKCQGITFDYDPITNNITFQQSTTTTTKNDIDDSSSCITTTTSRNKRRQRSLLIDGTDTGGQIIRFLLNWSIREYSQSTPTTELVLIDDFIVRSSGKSCMLYIQAAMMRLMVNQSFTVVGGNPNNNDGPSPKFLITQIFPLLKQILGLNFRLLIHQEAITNNNNSNDQNHNKETVVVPPKFTLIRDPDFAVDNNINYYEEEEEEEVSFCWESDQIYTTEIVDQLLMMIGYHYTGSSSVHHDSSTDIICHRKKKKIVLKCRMTKYDYHVNAIIKVMKSIINNNNNNPNDAASNNNNKLIDINVTEDDSTMTDGDNNHNYIRTIVVLVNNDDD